MGTRHRLWRQAASKAVYCIYTYMMEIFVSIFVPASVDEWSFVKRLDLGYPCSLMEVDNARDRIPRHMSKSSIVYYCS
jgi:hypothetical protein